MADLTEAVTRALAAMTELDSRATEVNGRVDAAAARGREGAAALESDLTRWHDAHARVQTTCGKLDRELGEAGARSARLTSESTARLLEAAAASRARHAELRTRLAALRSAAAELVRSLDAEEQAVTTRVAALRAAVTAAAGRAAAALDGVEQTHTRTTRKAVVAASDGVRDRAARLAQHVATTLEPRVNADVAAYGARLEALTRRLDGALRQTAGRTEEQATRQLAEFGRRSATDWHGGSGDVEAGATRRAGALDQTGARRGSDLKNGSAAARRASADLDEARATLRSHYSAVHAVPGRIEKLIQKL